MCAGAHAGRFLDERFIGDGYFLHSYVGPASFSNILATSEPLGYLSSQPSLWLRPWRAELLSCDLLHSRANVVSDWMDVYEGVSG